MADFHKFDDVISNYKLIIEMSQVVDLGYFKLYVYTEPLLNPSFHVRFPNNAELVLQMKDLKILEIKNNIEYFPEQLKKGNNIPSWFKRDILKILDSDNVQSKKSGIKITNRELLVTLWNSNNPQKEITINDIVKE